MTAELRCRSQQRHKRCSVGRCRGPGAARVAHCREAGVVASEPVGRASLSGGRGMTRPLERVVRRKGFGPPIRVFTPDAGKTLGGRGRRPWSDEPRRVQRGSVLPGSGLRRGSLLMVEISEVGGGRFRQKPCGGSWLDQSTHSGVPTPTSSEPRHGARLRISSFLNRRSSPVPTCSGPPRPAPVAAAARSCADYFGDFPQRGPRLRRRQRAGR